MENSLGWILGRLYPAIVEQHSTVYYRDYCVQPAGMIALAFVTKRCSSIKRLWAGLLVQQAGFVIVLNKLTETKHGSPYGWGRTLERFISWPAAVAACAQFP
jgi:hypothetical protein